MSQFNSHPPSCCSTLSASSSSSNSDGAATTSQLKIYQAFIFSVPIFFTFVLLLLFYLFYLRRRRVDWASLRMRADLHDNNDISRAELGLKKEVREMLPIIIYKESFFVKDSQCPVCLGDYQAEDRLQQIPACHHTFHMECIDHWLANHTTCPLCRLSLVAPAKVPNESPNNQVETGQESVMAGNGDQTSGQVDSGPESCGESPSTQLPETSNEDSNSEEQEERRSDSEYDDQGTEVIGTGQESVMGGNGDETSSQVDSGPESCGESPSTQLPETSNENSNAEEQQEQRSENADQGAEVIGGRHGPEEHGNNKRLPAESQA